MYVRTQQAFAWLDTESLPADFQVRTPPERNPAQTLMARKAFDGRLGRYIALRRIPASSGGKDLLLVGVANKSATERGPWWVKAEHALSEREAAQWAREGF